MRLVQVFRSRIRQRVKGKRQKKKKEKEEAGKSDEKPEGTSALTWYHSGILGVCALIEAYPYDVSIFTLGFVCTITLRDETM